MKICQMVLLFLFSLCSLYAQSLDEASTKNILKEINRTKGLALVIGNVADALSLAKNSEFYIHIIASKNTDMQKGKQSIHSANLEHRVSIIQLEEDFLPYVDNLINLIIFTSKNDSLKNESDAFRVCAPGGNIFIQKDLSSCITAMTKTDSIKKELGTFHSFQKNTPKGFDVWNHIKGSANQSYVNNDTEVAPWEETRWIADPKWGSLYSSYTGFVTAGGRIYYKESTRTNEGSTWLLICRDAYNGVELWREDIGGKDKHIRVPDYAVCCDENNIYYRTGMIMVSRDGATGKIVNKYKTEYPTDFSIVINDVLLLSTSRFLTALDKNTAQILWTKKILEYPAAEGNYAYVFTGEHIEALDLKTGAVAWSTEVGKLIKTQRDIVQLFVKDGTVYNLFYEKFTEDRTLMALDAQTGKEKWRETGQWSYGTIPYKEEVWLIGRSNKMKKESVSVKVLNTSSGSSREEYRVPGNVMGKCWGARGTANYFLYSNGWYYDKNAKTGHENNSTRSPCFIGQHPANGMTYYLPHHCACQVTYRGFLALAKKGNRAWLENFDESKTFKKGKASAANTKVTENDWPIYKKDMRRSNFTTNQISGTLTKSWSKKIAAKELSQATVANGLVYVCDESGEKLVALDEKNGEVKWSFFTNGTPRGSASLKEGHCLVGTGGGYIHCLNALTGEEIWSRRVAPTQKYISDRGKLDSNWPVAGSIMLKDDAAYFSVGRSSSQSLGLFTYSLNFKTGEVIWRNKMDRTVSGDLFVGDETSLLFVNLRYTYDSGKRITGKKGQEKVKYGLTMKNYLTPVSIVDYSNSIHPNQTDKRHEYLTDGEQEGDLFASTMDTSVCAGRYSTGYGKGQEWKPIHGQMFLKTKGKYNWAHHDMDIQIYGMVTAADKIYTVGIPKSLDPTKKTEIRVFNLTDGKCVQSMEVEGNPIYESLSVANGQLFLTTTDGNITAYKGER